VQSLGPACRGEECSSIGENTVQRQGGESEDPRKVRHKMHGKPKEELNQTNERELKTGRKRSGKRLIPTGYEIRGLDDNKTTDSEKQDKKNLRKVIPKDGVKR